MRHWRVVFSLFNNDTVHDAPFRVFERCKQDESGNVIPGFASQLHAVLLVVLAERCVTFDEAKVLMWVECEQGMRRDLLPIILQNIRWTSTLTQSMIGIWRISHRLEPFVYGRDYETYDNSREGSILRLRSSGERGKCRSYSRQGTKNSRWASLGVKTIDRGPSVHAWDWGWSDAVGWGWVYCHLDKGSSWTSGVGAVRGPGKSGA